MLMSCFE